MGTDARIANHYTRERLKDKILQAVSVTAPDPAHLTAIDFATVDEFHVGGIEATRHLSARMELRPGMHLLDVGSGIGGPARYFAGEHHCKITGIDLTKEFVEVAKSLTQIVKLDHLADFRQTSALALPFEPKTFDGAYMFHVGMNIADKVALCREVRRVLKAGGVFAVFDIMRTGTGPIRFPVPWALTEQTSFVAKPEDYRDALQAAGFRVVQEESRKAFAVQFTQEVVGRMAQPGSPAVGMQLLMGDKTRTMIGNILDAMQESVLEPVELFARAI